MLIIINWLLLSFSVKSLTTITTTKQRQEKENYNDNDNDDRDDDNHDDGIGIGISIGITINLVWSYFWNYCGSNFALSISTIELISAVREESESGLICFVQQLNVGDCGPIWSRPFSLTCSSLWMVKILYSRMSLSNSVETWFVFNSKDSSVRRWLMRGYHGLGMDISLNAN